MTLLGFAIAVAFGLALGVVIGASALMCAAPYPLLIGFNSIPEVAIVPILVIWFGIGAVPAVLTSFMYAIFAVLQRRFARLGVPRRQRRRLILPPPWRAAERLLHSHGN